MNIAAVSYLNTVPFLYGIRHSPGEGARLLLSPPAGCAEAFANGEADIALVPVGTLDELRDYDVVTDWCIGADGPVRTVVMVSDAPLSDIRRVWMDSHSRTSVRLAQILAKKYWKIKPEKWVPYHPAPDGAPLLNKEGKGDAWVLIGDKVFEAEGKFRHSWDLAAEWIAWTKLPMVFAVWIARKGTPRETIDALEDALTLGVERIYEAIQESEFAEKEYAYDYLTRNIDYLFDQPKRAALTKFRAEK